MYVVRKPRKRNVVSFKIVEEASNIAIRNSETSYCNPSLKGANERERKSPTRILFKLSPFKLSPCRKFRSNLMRACSGEVEMQTRESRKISVDAKS